ncbi:UNVERIFIED_CONTAM: hypothetical protein FKN15_048392 [Acipenser sinensis]
MAVTRRVSHLLRYLSDCQTNNTKPEEEFELNLDELFYIDFDKEAVLRLARFSDHWSVGPDVVATAEANREACTINVTSFAKCHKYPPEKQDQDSTNTEHASCVCYMLSDQDSTNTEHESSLCYMLSDQDSTM